jgi:hypothetical protein
MLKKNIRPSLVVSPPAPMVQGKWLIIGVGLVALVGSLGSWTFRYYATHRSTAFWSPQIMQLIRDAPNVTLYKHPIVPTDTLVADFQDVSATEAAIQKHIDSTAIDISNAKGLVNLRYAFSDDGNFDWPAQDDHWPNPADDIGYWWLTFLDPSNGKTTTIWFSEDCRQALRAAPDSNGKLHGTPISTEPMAAGLREMFGDFSANVAATSKQN